MSCDGQACDTRGSPAVRETRACTLSWLVCFQKFNEFEWYLAHASEASELCAQRRVASLRVAAGAIMAGFLRQRRY